MSRILFLTPQLPHPPHQGAAIRNLNLIKIAAERHELALYSFVRTPAEAEAADVLREWCAEVRTFPAPKRSLVERALLTAFSPEPDMGRRLQLAELAEAVGEAQADLVQAEGIEMAQYLDATSAPSVLDCHNAEWVLQRRTFQLDLARRRPLGAAYSLMQWLKLRRYERTACRRAGAVVAVSEVDRQALLDLDRRLEVSVVPNGVDAAFFAPAANPPAPHTFLFTGTLDFRPNVDAVLWLAREVWPRIRQALPDAELVLAGRAPVPAIRRLHGRDGVCVEPSPADIRPAFAAAAVYLAPLRAGGGSRYKLLQALSMGLGIVSTTLGAEGLAAEDGVHLQLADTPEAIASAAVKLAGNEALRRRLGGAARELVLARYDWPRLAPALNAVYDRALPVAA